MGNVIDIPDESVEAVAFMAHTLFQHRSFLWFHAFDALPAGLYFWQEARRSILETRIIFEDYKIRQKFVSKCNKLGMWENFDMAEEHCLVLVPEVYDIWACANAVYTVDNISSQKAQLAVMLSHFSTPESR